MILYDFFFSHMHHFHHLYTLYTKKKKRKKDDDVYFAPNQVSLVPFSQKLLYESIIIIIIIMIMLLRQRKTTEDKSCQFDIRQGKITFCSIEFRRVLCLLLIFGITYTRKEKQFWYVANHLDIYFLTGRSGKKVENWTRTCSFFFCESHFLSQWIRKAKSPAKCVFKVDWISREWYYKCHKFDRNLYEKEILSKVWEKFY